WLKTGRREDVELPRIFYVNWFRKDDDGKFLWPGFGENSRVLAWIFRRCASEAEAVETPIGLVPPVGEGGIETEGLDIARGAVVVAAPRSVARPGWLERFRGRGWALLPIGSIVVVVFAIRYVSDTATGLTWLALIAVPILAAAALGWAMRGARPPAAFLAIPL